MLWRGFAKQVFGEGEKESLAQSSPAVRTPIQLPPPNDREGGHQIKSYLGHGVELKSSLCLPVWPL